MLKSLIVKLIKIYQKVSYLLPGRCRFYPSCSQYSIEAIQKYTISQGIWLSIRRIVKCNPFHPGGIDELK